MVYQTNVKFYLLNNDFPAEWFEGINRKLNVLNSDIVDVKCDNEEIKKYKTLEHIGSEATFFRYFISQYIPEDKVLYLDADIIINGNIAHIFDIALDHYFLAASTDHIGEIVFNTPQHYFNAGVLLINNRLWREHQAHKVLMELSEKHIHQVSAADQDILNMAFGNHYLRLNRFFNYQVGGDYFFQQYGKAEYIEDLGNQIPIIVHFNSPAKPWLNYQSIRFRHLYWHYFHLDWQDIYHNHQK